VELGGVNVVDRQLQKVNILCNDEVASTFEHFSNLLISPDTVPSARLEFKRGNSTLEQWDRVQTAKNGVRRGRGVCQGAGAMD
jgi:hypothetical protein